VLAGWLSRSLSRLWPSLSPLYAVLSADLYTRRGSSRPPSPPPQRASPSHKGGAERQCIKPYLQSLRSPLKGQLKEAERASEGYVCYPVTSPRAGPFQEDFGSSPRRREGERKWFSQHPLRWKGGGNLFLSLPMRPSAPDVSLPPPLDERSAFLAVEADAAIRTVQ